ncbi:hypothetical protein [Nocardia sp. NPDC052566]|uniref:hypothetical protein n=1 Tax=Nocardia sp. NPDC052566 TaxID=3364330 RepID=UPI0037C965D6
MPKCGGNRDLYFGTYRGRVKRQFNEEWLKEYIEALTKPAQKNRDSDKPKDLLEGIVSALAKKFDETVMKKTGGDPAKIRKYLGDWLGAKDVEISVTFSYGKKSTGNADYWADGVYNKFESSSGYTLDLQSTPHRVEFGLATGKTVTKGSGISATQVNPANAWEFVHGGWSHTPRESFKLQALDCADDGVPQRLYSVEKTNITTRTIELTRQS